MSEGGWITLIGLGLGVAAIITGSIPAAIFGAAIIISAEIGDLK